MQFDNGGVFRIADEETANQLPKFHLLTGDGATALTLSMGRTEREIFTMSDVEGAPAPVVSSFLVKGPKAELDVLVPIVMDVGGSDCGYEATVVGITKGHPKEWLRHQPFVNSQGGYYVGDLGARRGYGFAAWNFLWEGGGHYGPHRYQVKLYRFRPESGSAVLVQQLETQREFDGPEEALKSLGLNFPNLLRLDKIFDC